MTKNKKHASRCYVEQTDLYETSDLSDMLGKKLHYRTHHQKHIKAASAEDLSHQKAEKIVAANAPVEDIILVAPDETPATDLRDTWIDEQ